MIAFGLAALFTIASVVAVAAIAFAARRAMIEGKAIKAALAGCAETRELRFTIRELVVTPPRGNVVTLPVRLKLGPQPLRAAA